MTEKSAWVYGYRSNGRPTSSVPCPCIPEYPFHLHIYSRSACSMTRIHVSLNTLTYMYGLYVYIICQRFIFYSIHFYDIHFYYIPIFIFIFTYPYFYLHFYLNVTTLRSGLCCRKSVCLSVVCL